MTDSNDDLLVESLLSAHRERDPRGELRFHPAFYDLDAPGRERAADVALVQRTLEAALDPEGWSSTVRAVLGKIE
jgi:hypothetical protein